MTHHQDHNKRSDWDLSSYRVLGADCPISVVMDQLEDDFKELDVTSGKDKQKMALRVLVMRPSRELSQWYASERARLTNLPDNRKWTEFKSSILAGLSQPFSVRGFASGTTVGQPDDKEATVESNSDEAVKSFDTMNLKDDLLRGIYNAGLDKPSIFQQRVIISCIRG